MNLNESVFFFDCCEESLLGIVSSPLETVAQTGVLVIVGGPQYRVGSHRQFVLLARQLALQGIPCMRFDYRGMGDSTGAVRSFEDVDDDIRAALDAFFVHVPAMRKVVLWGLCDGASAACFYAPHDERVAGMVLLNPWVKTAAGEAKTLLKHYYLQRLLSRAFWKKLLSGNVSVGKSLGGLNAAVAQSGAGNVSASGVLPDLPRRMALALRAAGKPFVVLLSGRDYVAREFEQTVVSAAWDGLDAVHQPMHVSEADHTFSSAAWRNEVAVRTAEWVGSLDGTSTNPKLNAGGQS